MHGDCDSQAVSKNVAQSVNDVLEYREEATSVSAAVEAESVLRYPDVPSGLTLKRQNKTYPPCGKHAQTVPELWRFTVTSHQNIFQFCFEQK